MANFITHSITWAGKETLEYLIKPLLIGKNPAELKGFRVMANVADKQKLNYFGSSAKRMKVYAKGFSATSGATYAQRDIETVKLKGEWAEDGHDFLHTVFNQATHKGVAENDINGTILNNIMTDLIMKDVKADIFRKAFLNDTNLESLTSGKYNGTANADYNEFDGIVKKLRDNSSLTPTAGTHVKKVAYLSGGVKQKSTTSLSGTSGTATFALGGKSYLVTFNTTLTQTAIDFAAANLAAFALRSLTLTASSGDIVVESSRAGMPFAAPTIINVSGNLAGSVVATTANTANSALSAGLTLSTMKSLMETCQPVLQAEPAENKCFLMDYLSYYNWIASMEAKTTTEAGYFAEFNGISVPMLRGVQIIPVEVDSYLTADFPIGYESFICLCTHDNLILATDAYSDYNAFQAWFNTDQEENRFRVTFKMGVNYVHPDMTAIAF